MEIIIGIIGVIIVARIGFDSLVQIAEKKLDLKIERLRCEAAKLNIRNEALKREIEIMQLTAVTEIHAQTLDKMIKKESE